MALNRNKIAEAKGIVDTVPPLVLLIDGGCLTNIGKNIEIYVPDESIVLGA